jgi:hypothetical protein
VRLRRRRDDLSASSSRSFEVASSIAIFFMLKSISAMSDCAQALRFVSPAWCAYGHQARRRRKT